jgi:predicted chitinase
MLLALAYWDRAKLNALADRSDWRACRVAINGGVIGLSEVAMIRAKALAILA